MIPEKTLRLALDSWDTVIALCDELRDGKWRANKVQLLPPIQSDDDGRAGYPSASSYERLFNCRASYLLSRKAVALGQVAHERSPAAELGTRKHLASTEGPEILSAAEREDWETCQRKREEFIRGWLGDSQEAFRTCLRMHGVWWLDDSLSERSDGGAVGAD